MAGTTVAKTNREDIMSSKSTYALLGSLTVSLVIWAGAFAFLV